MKNDEKLLGYQLRKLPKTIDMNYWTNERRSKFLLKSDIFYPISVDTNAWPEVDSEDLKKKLFITEEVEYDALYLETELQQLKYPLHELKIEDLKDNVLIAITILKEYASLFFKKRSIDKMEFPINIDELKESGMIFLGYDIADGLLFSSLSDCEEKVSGPEN